jgi:hypothetical protein
VQVGNSIVRFSGSASFLLIVQYLRNNATRVSTIKADSCQVFLR